METKENLLSDAPIQLESQPKRKQNQRQVADTVGDETPLKVYKFNENAITPTKGTKSSAGYDLHALLEPGSQVTYYTSDNQKLTREVKADGSILINPGERMLIPTGLQLVISEGYFVGIYPRSGVSLKSGLSLANKVGVIDSDYVNETMITTTNYSRSRVVIPNGERLAQMIVHKLHQTDVVLEVLDKPKEETTRSGGFGSTGRGK